ncbi:sialate O-acetylesterase [Lentisphaera profundi]|uniref:Sialate O-acetylesterase n=1 Tax=Lentisphaera profundi TaxID=1658616 RepID=A0ABY7VV30_9BACT|nr:sialate O-acetylesterase [Lentisphaera profundi]WDE97609.1 sialate O-acetylesterase [Lentisphaera profundi]
MPSFKNLINLTIIAISSQVYADISLPQIIDSQMILQRDAKVPIWGWADKGEQVTVQFAGQTKTATPNESGKWMIDLDPMPASNEARSMIIKGKNTINLNDILVGEVWLASGQSNMEWTFNGIEKKEYEAALKQKNNNDIRFFHVTHHLQAGAPMDDTIGSWKKAEEFLATPHSVSAVATFFAIKLQKELAIPIAILDSNWGGMRVDCFISEEGYKSENLPLRKHGVAQPNIRLQKLKQMRDSLNQTIALAEKGISASYIEERINGWADNMIYNAMIAPLAPYAIKGAIWYQGESNRGDAKYFKKMKALSFGWSKAFRVKDIPLIQVQIAPFDYTRGKNPKDSTLCDTIWKAQYKAAKELKGIEVVAIHDININIKDIHPRSKELVGQRLAAIALKNTYGKNLIAQGPQFASAKTQGQKVILSFDNIDQGLSTKDNKAPTHFELSNDGKNFIAAEAIIQGNSIVVSSTQVSTPKFVRMGWSDIAIPNLQDKNGWPVFAFPAQPIK